MDSNRIRQAIGEALAAFWQARKAARERSGEKSGRGEATSGRHLDSLIEVLRGLVVAAGLREAEVFVHKRAVLPGYFRPTKEWDFVVVYRGKLAIAVELKSHVGSYGNNFNNRIEEAVGSAHDLNWAMREGVLQPFVPSEGLRRPFRGWLMVLANDEEVLKPGKKARALFPVDESFLEDGRIVSYWDRYKLFAKRLVMAGLYDAAAVVLADRNAATFDDFGLDVFLGELAFFAARLAHIAE